MRPRQSEETAGGSAWNLSVDTEPGQVVLPTSWATASILPRSDLQFLYQETERGPALTPSGIPMECAGFLYSAILTERSSSCPARAKATKPDPSPRGDSTQDCSHWGKIMAFAIDVFQSQPDL